MTTSPERTSTIVIVSNNPVTKQLMVFVLAALVPKIRLTFWNVKSLPEIIPLLGIFSKFSPSKNEDWYKRLYSLLEK